MSPIIYERNIYITKFRMMMDIITVSLAVIAGEMHTIHLLHFIMISSVKDKIIS